MVSHQLPRQSSGGRRAWDSAQPTSCVSLTAVSVPLCRTWEPAVVLRGTGLRPPEELMLEVLCKPSSDLVCASEGGFPFTDETPKKALVVSWAFGQQKNYVCMCVSGSGSSGSCRSFTFLSLHFQTYHSCNRNLRMPSVCQPFIRCWR